MDTPEPSLAATIPARRGVLDLLEVTLRRNGYYLAVLTAWLATLGSLYFSEVAGFVPCTLCWYQRIAMYPLAVLIPVGLLARDRSIWLYTLPLTLIGTALAIYHRLIEEGIVHEGFACEKGVPCSARYINWFGFVTIPTLALAAFLIITFAVSASHRAPEWRNPASRPRPWRGVLLAIGLAIAFMAGVLVFDGR